MIPPKKKEIHKNKINQDISVTNADITPQIKVNIEQYKQSECNQIYNFINIIKVDCLTIPT